VTNCKDAATVGDHWLRCRHRVQLQLRLPLSLIPFCSSHWQWIWNDHVGLWIRDVGRQVFITTERGRSASNATCGAGYNVMCWVCLWRFSGCWCTPCGSWSNYSPSLCRGRGGSHALSDICNVRIVQRSWGGGDLTLDCRGYGTLSLRGIPLASQYGTVYLSRGKLRIPRRPMLLLILTISMTSNISYKQRGLWVKALGRHYPIWMFDVKSIGIVSSACIYKGRWGRLLFERQWRDLTKKGGTVLTVLNSKHWQYSGMTSLEKHSIMRCTAIRFNSDWTQHWYSLLQQCLKVYFHRLSSVYAFLAWLSSYCTRSWDNTLNHRLCISSASWWKTPFGREKSIAKWTLTYSLSYNISCVCIIHR